MKAICIEEPGKVVVKEIDKPVRKPGEALLKMIYGGICGSDLGSYRGANAYVSYPRVPGHELAAEIVEIDENDKGLKPGMIVTCNPYFNCGSCYLLQLRLVLLLPPRPRERLHRQPDDGRAARGRLRRVHHDADRAHLRRQGAAREDARAHRAVLHQLARRFARGREGGRARARRRRGDHRRARGGRG